MPETLVRVENVSKKFCRGLRRSLWYGLQDIGSELRGRPHAAQHELRPEEFWAVKDVSFDLKRGECLGLIGHNGAGKTTLLRMLNGLIKPDTGRIEMRGRIGALIALGAGFHPLLTGRENIYINASILGISKKDMNVLFDRIVDFAGLGAFIDSPVTNYSSGMYVRLGFSITVHTEPAVLLVDEALAVGDAAFVAQCLNKVAELRQNGTGVIFVSHSEVQVREAATRCALMSRGLLLHDGDLATAFLRYDQIQDESLASETTYAHEGPIRITHCRLNTANSGGNPLSGGQLSVAMECASTARLDNVLLHLRIWNTKGQVVASIRSSSPLIVSEGITAVNVNIPAVNLVPGRYRLAGGFRRDGAVVGWARSLAQFDLMPAADAQSGEGISFMRAEIVLVNRDTQPTTPAARQGAP